jgi:uncharacterized phage protein (TIGR01671 family)
MMKEIKLRYWDKENKKMVYQGTDFIGGVMFISEHWGDIKKYCESDSDMQESNDSNIVFMQYIGLLDKNGNEIYEGDTLDNGGVITSHKGQFRPKFYNGFQPIQYNWNESVEVVGNIYEEGDTNES